MNADVMIATSIPNFLIRPAEREDVPLLLAFIRDLAEYEKLAHEVVATESILEESLFGERSYAESLLGYFNNKPVAFALFFHNFSTFTGKPGIYLEDLFVKPEARGKGLGKEMLCQLAKIANERGCTRLEWSVLDWNKPAIDFYLSMGSKPMDEWTVHRLSGESLKQYG